MRVPRINMKIIELNLSHDNFYCPVTGCHIQSEEHFEPAGALVAGWHSEILNEPLVLKGKFQAKWDEYVAKQDEAEDFLNISEFLNSVENENFVCFEITTREIACNGGPVDSTVWFVIDFDFRKEGS